MKDGLAAGPVGTTAWTGESFSNWRVFPRRLWSAAAHSHPTPGPTQPLAAAPAVVGGRPQPPDATATRPRLWPRAFFGAGTFNGMSPYSSPEPCRVSPFKPLVELQRVA